MDAEHLFISYATEDAQLAEWLTLKLTGEGYKVWCDRVKLLGGESYPRDIDWAIKHSTFRVIALLSRHSLQKPNPTKERTLGHSISRERKVDFVIPLNVDGLSATELDWMNADLTFIPFQESWADGFAQLLKKLEAIGAPRPLQDGKERITRFVSLQRAVTPTPERLWTNIVEITDMPRTLLRYAFGQSHWPPLPRDWVYHQEGSVLWAFEEPKGEMELSAKKDLVDWGSCAGEYVPTSDVVTSLIKKHLRLFCLQKGLVETWDRRHVYFSPHTVPEGWLHFTGYNGKATRVRPWGFRTFRLAAGSVEKCRYHLSPVFRPIVSDDGKAVVQVQLRVYLTYTDGHPLDESAHVRRRKRICKYWWNHEWLSRLLAVVSWMAGGRPAFNIAQSGPCRLCLSGFPMRLTAPVGIDETLLTPIGTEAESALIDDVADSPDETSTTGQMEAID